MPPAERESTSATRSAAHAVHVLHHDARADERVLHPALDRVDASKDAVQALILVPDPETAVALAEAARAEGSAVALIPLTSASRGARQLRAGAVHAVVATPRLAAALRHAAALKLEDVSTIVFAWTDEMLAAGEGEALDAVLADVPAGARILVTSELTDEVRAVEERHLRRPRHEDARAEGAEPVTLRYVETAPTGRATALRRLLDELDPPSAAVVAWSDEAAEDAARSLATLGYGAADATIRLTRGAVEENTTLVVCYELPPDAAALATVAAARPSAVAALVAPRQVPALRQLSAGAAVPWMPAQAIAKARARAEKVRDALRAELAEEWPAREVMILEPLLAEFDGVELAAAAVRLVERERARSATLRPSAAVAAPAQVSAPTAPEGFTRVFLSIGEEDGVRKGDLVGAIAGESGITSNEIGRIEIRDRHTLAEIATAVHERVIEKMNGVSIRGRRITARVDKGREGGPPREGARAPSRGGPRSFDRGDRGAPRGDRGAPRGGPRSFDRGDRSERGDREERAPRSGGGARSFDRGDRGGPPRGGPRAGGPRAGGPRAGGSRPGGPPRSGGFGKGPGRDRDERPARGPRAREEHREWADRGERVKNARRPRRDDA